MFDDFRRFSLKNHVLYMKIEPGWWGMSPGYILEYFCLWERPQRPHCESQNLNFHIFRPHFGNVHFDFSSQTLFLSHESSNPSCTKCSYGPYGQFWFSAKQLQDMETRYQKNYFWENMDLGFVFEISAGRVVTSSEPRIDVLRAAY